MRKRFIVTGGPGAGKTSTMAVLQARGYVCVPDVARAVIQKRLSAGLSPRPHPAEFAWEVFNRDAAQYDFVRDVVAFFDRCLVDSLAMLFECGELEMEHVREYLVQRPFERRAFFFPPWKEIYTKDSERDQSFSEAVDVSDRIRKWYASVGFQLVDIPKGSSYERADFIEARISGRESDLLP